MSNNETNETNEMVLSIEEIEEDEMNIIFQQIEFETNSQNKISQYLLLSQSTRFDEIAIKIKENIFYKLSKLYTELKQFDNVVGLLQTSNEYFSIIPKARTAKIVRNILDIVSKVPDSLIIQVRLCKDVVTWCNLEKRNFLRQRIESKLAHLLLLQKEPRNALLLINSLLTELRKLDDKQMLTEAHLTESRIHHALRNIPKAKAALTAARTSAHAIYVTPILQAELDEMSGVLHCEENDYITAYSYFLEAYDGYDQSNDTRSLTCLQYMILCKVLNGSAHEVQSLLSSKIGLKHSTGITIQAMDAVAKSATEKSLEKFELAVNQYSDYLKNDHLIAHNLDKLYDKMFESNLLKIINPYSVVEISHVAKRINLPIETVERKLSQMILDHVFAGILDQGKGELIIFDEIIENKNYSYGIDIINNMGSVVEALSTRATNLQKM